jgi:hypothetical protein
MRAILASAFLALSITIAVLGGCAKGSTFPTTTGTTGDTCTGTPCELVAPQCGCPEGDACTFVGTAATPSCSMAGAIAVGQACDGPNTCEAGSICLGDGTVGGCTAFCATDGDCAATGGICALQLSDGNGGAIPNENLCSNTCDPVAATGCPVGLGCQVGAEPSGQMRTFTVCESAGAGTQGEVCGTSADCATGFNCVTSTDGITTLCLQYCYVGVAQTGCATCTPLSSSAQTSLVVNGKQVGVCQ